MQESFDLATDLWKQVVAALESKLTRPIYQNWLRKTQPLSLAEDTLTVGVPSEFARDWLDKKARRSIRAAIRSLLDRPLEVQFVVSQMSLELEPPAARPRRPVPRRREEESFTPLNPKYTFDNFVVGKNNQFAHAAALAVSRTPAKTYNPLFIYGGAGLGKTHLMQAIGHQVQASSPQLQVAYVSGETFTYEVVSSIRDDRFGSFRTRYRNVDIWLVDDIQFIASKERTESEFFQLFNALYDTNRQIVVSSDRPPKELRVLDARLRSRFEWGLLADMKVPDVETRIVILEKKARLEGLEVPMEVIRYIASVVSSNIRSLEGALTKVAAASSFLEVQLNLALAMDQLKDYVEGEAVRPISVAQVQEAVAQHFNLTIPEMVAARRTRDVMLPRQLAMYLSRELVKASFPEIAKRFGGKDHSTVIHAHHKVTRLLKDDPHLRALASEITNGLRVSS